MLFTQWLQIKMSAWQEFEGFFIPLTLHHLKLNVHSDVLALLVILDHLL